MKWPFYSPVTSSVWKMLPSAEMLQRSNDVTSVNSSRFMFYSFQRSNIDGGSVSPVVLLLTMKSVFFYFNGDARRHRSWRVVTVRTPDPWPLNPDPRPPTRKKPTTRFLHFISCQTVRIRSTLTLNLLRLKCWNVPFQSAASVRHDSYLLVCLRQVKFQIVSAERFYATDLYFPIVPAVVTL